MFRVLVPIDSDTDRSLRQTAFVASLPHATEDVEATLVHVFTDEETAAKTSVDQVTAGRRCHEFFTERDIAVRTESRFGDPATEILHAADDIDADLVVLGGRKLSPLGSLLFGSVSQAVTLDSNRPVAIAGGATGPMAEIPVSEETDVGDGAAESGETSA
ncbi:Nucleotide-binding universal stress protein, UspA family [Halogranum gelatinilyticum]|uniref:Nucleotide-binding universal stress protein, UspA family n=1 Tax=Halogranum gelatinilyticum TaxID=660521 RepID=A0A1G9QJP6_9EURY|nr:universal stress protein [Halogranum gelatinilyticum]SDM11264.1 Nucleotide-binding universal stress protein, UspA family [Halogranum gelatinilyticum]